MVENIVFVSDYGYTEGGASQVAISMALSMTKFTNKNIYFISGTEFICDELIESNIVVYSLKENDLLSEHNRVKAFVRGIYKKRVENEIYSLLEKFDPKNTIVHVHTYTKVLSSACFRAINRRNLELCISIHDYFLACPNGGFYNYKKKEICRIMPCSHQCIICNCDSRHYYHKIFRLLRQIVQNSVIKNCSNISLIYLSQFSKNKLEPCLKFAKCSYLMHNPITFSRRARICAENNNIYIYIGRVAYDKGTDIFCKAISIMDVRGIVVGDGNQKDILEKKYSNIEFVGWQSKEQISSILNKVRCLVFPSPILEVSPLTVPEVQAYGIPCIVTSTCAAVDFVEDGITGSVVSATVEGLCEGIEKMNDDRYVQQLSENTFRDFAEDEFTEEGVVNAALNIYERIIAKANID